MPHLSDQELLEELRSLGWRLQRIPRAKDMGKYGRYSPELYLDRFAGWDAALAAADIRDLREPAISQVRLQRHLQEVGTETTRTPTRADLRAVGELSPWLYVDNFKSWRAALKEAGFDIVPRTSPQQATVTHEQLRQTLTQLADEIGHTPSKDEVDKYADYASDLYCAAFGSWDVALDLAGLAEHSVHGAPTYSTTELLTHLQELATELGKTPTAEEMNTHGRFAEGTYQNRFGSWNFALHQANLEPTVSTDSFPSDTDLTNELRQLASELGRPPTPAEADERGAYHPQSYLIQFDSWTQAINSAGLNPADAWKR